MQQVIYADVLFLIDLSMDFLALYIVSSMMKLSCGKYNLAFAAAIGAVYSVTAVIYRSDSILIAALIAVLMMVAAFGLCSPSRIIVRSVVFLVVNFILGGAMTAIFNIFNSFGRERFVMLYGEVAQVERKMPFSVFAVGFGITAVIAVIFVRIFLPSIKTAFTDTEICYGKKKLKLRLLCDSGNLLTEPISGDPVIFLSESSMIRLTGENVITALKNSEPEFLRRNLRSARLLLYETVAGSQSGICLRPDRITVNGKPCRAWVCLAPSEISNADGIVPVSLLT